MKFAERLEELGLDLVLELYKTLPDLLPKEKATALVAMMRYCYPSLKAVEVTVDDPKKIFAVADNVALLCEIARSASLEASKNFDTEK